MNVNYKTIMLCAVIGASMQSARGMHVLEEMWDDEIQRDLAALLKAEGLVDYEKKQDLDEISKANAAAKRNENPPPQNPNAKPMAKQEDSEITQSAATIKALQQIIAERDAQLQVNDARIKELEGVISMMRAAGEENWLNSLD